MWGSTILLKHFIIKKVLLACSHSGRMEDSFLGDDGGGLEGNVEYGSEIIC